MDKVRENLCRRIEKERDRMHKIAHKMGLSHPDTVRISRRLDKLIVQYLCCKYEFASDNCHQK